MFVFWQWMLFDKQEVWKQCLCFGPFGNTLLMAWFHLVYTFGNYLREPMPSSAKMRRVTFFSSYMGWNESFAMEILHRPALSYIHFPCHPVVSYKDYHVAFGLASFGLGLVCSLGSLTVQNILTGETGRLLNFIMLISQLMIIGSHNVCVYPP